MGSILSAFNTNPKLLNPACISQRPRGAVKTQMRGSASGGSDPVDLGQGQGFSLLTNSQCLGTWLAKRPPFESHWPHPFFPEEGIVLTHQPENPSLSIASACPAGMALPTFGAPPRAPGMLQLSPCYSPLKAGVVHLCFTLGKPRHREVKSRVGCHTASQRQSWDVHPGSLAEHTAQVLN